VAIRNLCEHDDQHHLYNFYHATRLAAQALKCQDRYEEAKAVLDFGYKTRPTAFEFRPSDEEPHTITLRQTPFKRRPTTLQRRLGKVELDEDGYIKENFEFAAFHREHSGYGVKQQASKEEVRRMQSMTGRML
jgi:hypothetical protein